MKILKAFIFLIILLVISSNNNVNSYIGNSLIKYYGNEWETGVLPMVEVKVLKEGIDYKRRWAFTRNIITDISKLDYLNKEEALKEKQLPGKVCEKITFLKHNKEVIKCHKIYGYSYLKVDNSIMGENDEDTFSYQFNNCNNLKDDLSLLFDIKIKKEIINEEYKLVPKIILKDKNIVLNYKSKKNIITYTFKDLGYIIIELVNGDLTILEDELYDEYITTPNTGI